MELLKETERIIYSLPQERIALYPAVPRDSCRLMVVSLPGFKVEDRIFRDIVDYLEQGDVVAVNDSRVIPSQLKGAKKTGGKAEFLLLEKVSPASWHALGKPSSRLREGMRIDIFSSNGKKCFIEIHKKYRNGLFIINTPENILDYGYIPLPPYITARRGVLESDSNEYQTNFAVKKGSVASPTAALHFSVELIEKLNKKGVLFAPVTLHVGPGTFRVNYDQPESERYRLNKKSAKILDRAERICVCGTTAMRTVETTFDGTEFVPASGRTDLFIKPGYRFGRVKMFITNFHLQGTPLLLMVAAYLEQFFPGQGAEKLIELYSNALKKEYRFLSYGDAMLLIDER